MFREVESQPGRRERGTPRTRRTRADFTCACWHCEVGWGCMGRALLQTFGLSLSNSCCLSFAGACIRALGQETFDVVYDLVKQQAEAEADGAEEEFETKLADALKDYQPAGEMERAGG
jgi:hypothetical protein